MSEGLPKDDVPPRPLTPRFPRLKFTPVNGLGSASATFLGTSCTSTWLRNEELKVWLHVPRILKSRVTRLKAPPLLSGLPVRLLLCEYSNFKPMELAALGVKSNLTRGLWSRTLLSKMCASRCRMVDSAG